MTLSSEVWPNADTENEKYHPCRMEGNSVVRVELKLSVEPTVGETITGASSGATGVVEEVVTEGAATYAMLTSPTGIDSDTGTAFTSGENLNGSTSGAAFATASQVGLKKSYGRLFPESALVQEDGGYYCKFHHAMKYGPRRRDEARIDVQEEQD